MSCGNATKFFNFDNIFVDRKMCSFDANPFSNLRDVDRLQNNDEPLRMTFLHLRINRQIYGYNRETLASKLIIDLQLNYLLKKDTSHIIDSTRKEVVQALLVFFKFYFHIFPQEGFCFCFQFKFSLSTSLMNLSCYRLWLVDLIVVRSREECYERP